MKIATFLDRNDVTAAVPAGDKREVLATLVDLLVSNHDELERDVLLSVLLKREELRSTGFPASPRCCRASAAAARASTSTPSTASRPTSSSSC